MRKSKLVNVNRQEIIHKNFDKYLKKNNLNQKEYADKVNISSSTVSKWITNNGAKMTAEDIYTASKIFNININHLYYTEREIGQIELEKDPNYEKVLAQKSKEIILFKDTLDNLKSHLLKTVFFVIIIFSIILFAKLIKTEYIYFIFMPFLLYIMTSKTNRVKETFIINYIDDIYYKGNANFYRKWMKILDIFFKFLPAIIFFFIIILIGPNESFENSTTFNIYIFMSFVYLFLSLLTTNNQLKYNFTLMDDYEINNIFKKTTLFIYGLVFMIISFVILLVIKISFIYFLISTILFVVQIIDIITCFRWFKTFEAVYEDENSEIKLYK